MQMTYLILYFLDRYVTYLIDIHTSLIDMHIFYLIFIWHLWACNEIMQITLL